MYKRTVSTLIALALLLMAVPLFFDTASAADSKPVFGSNLSDTTATTGDAFDFEINVTDDYSVTAVYVEYWFGTGSSTNTSMSLTGNNWTYSITIPTSSIDSLYYRFHAVDNASQWAHFPSATTFVTQTVTDNDDPTMTDSSSGTGTTGDSFIFDVAASDNIAVSGVTVTWSHGSLSGTSVAMTDDLDGTFSLTVTLDDSLSSMSYTVTVTDSSSNTLTGSAQIVTVTDDDTPTMTDNSPGSGTTGDSYTFDVTASDNIALSGVAVTWSHGILSGTSVAMTDDGDGTWSLSITLDDSTSSLSYTIVATDSSSNTASYSDTASVSDNDNPVLSVDYSPGSGTTGDSYTFDVNATDNIGVDSVTVTWSHGSLGGTDAALTDDGDGSYSLTITLDDSLSSMTYAITVNDAAGNSVTGSGEMVLVSDNDDPTMTDNSPSFGTTGDSYTFDVSASDNIALNGLTVTWSHGSLGGTDVALSNDGDGTWSLTITLDSSLSSMTYALTVEDTSSNSVTGSLTTVTVTDNDAPTFSNAVLNPNPPTTGESVQISVDIDDNSAVDTTSAALYYNFGSGYLSSTSYTESSGTYTFTVTAPSDSTSVSFYFTADDTSSNTGTSTTWMSSVTDNDDPSLDADNSPGTGTTGDQFTFDITASDNVDVGGVSVSWSHGSRSGTASLRDDRDGTWSGSITLDHSTSSMTYTVTVTDTSANTDVGTLQTVTVTDNDQPTFTRDNTPSPATTGDSFTFSVEVDDNIDGTEVNSVYVYYCYGNDWSGITGNVSLSYVSAEGTWDGSITVIDTLSSIYYNISARDDAGNWNTWTGYIRPVNDNDAPSVTSDTTSGAGTTGDPHNFTMTASDNIDVYRVYLSYVYAGGGNVYNNLMMNEGPGGLWYLVQTLEDTTSALSYNFTVVDTSMNSFTSSFNGVTITDNDNPYLHTDMSDREAEAGKAFVFKTMASDNIDVLSVNVEYWYSFNSQRTTTPMALLSDNIYYLEIDLPAQPGTLYYIFNTQDVNSNDGTTGERTVEILDITAPVIDSVTYSDTAYTGDAYTLTSVVTDDVEVNFVKMYYFYGSVMPDTPMVMTGSASGDTYTFDLTIPDSLDMLNFWLMSEDMEGNMVETSHYMVMVMDNDLPTLLEDLTDTGAFTGEPFMFKVNATDNIGIGWVNVTFMAPGGDWVTVTLNNMDMTYYLEIMLPDDVRGEMSYFMDIYDTSMNLLTTDTVVLDLVDDEEPVAVIDGPIHEFQHVMVFFNAMGSSDNVGIDSYTWEIDGNVLSGMEVNYTFDVVGIYTIELKVSDGINPTVSTSYDIEIRDSDDPVISVDVPTLIGNHELLSLNASASSDNVGISAYNWLLILPDNTRITGMGPLFDQSLEGVLGTVTIYLTVSDAEGNSVQEMFIIDVVDLLPPTVVVPDDIEELEGVYLTFDGGNSFDNTGVTKWIWHLTSADLDIEFSGREFPHFFELPARYNITLTVFDSANNSASDFFIVNILAKGAEFDTDGDGLPDDWEEEVGLDPTLDDASRDYDGDLLTNLKEYELHTDPKDSDTDGDGMPDQYEYKYAYHEGRTDLVDGVPRWMVEFTAEGDADEDGDNNIAEFRDGYRDPTVKDAEEESEDNSSTYIVLAVIILVILLLVIVAMIIFMGRVKKVEEDFPEGQYPHLYKSLDKKEETPENK